MKGTLVLTHVVQTGADSYTANADFTPDGPDPIPTPIPPTPTPGTGKPVPDGWDRDENVGYSMLVEAMTANGLTPIGVQNHGDQIVQALNEYWAFPQDKPVWRTTKDAPAWFPYGSLDVTIDSGKGGWSFRPDGDTPYYPIG